MFKGWKTFSFGTAVAIAPALVDYLGGVDMAALGLDPKIAAALGVAIVALRAVTKTPPASPQAVISAFARKTKR